MVGLCSISPFCLSPKKLNSIQIRSIRNVPNQLNINFWIFRELFDYISLMDLAVIPKNGNLLIGQYGSDFSKNLLDILSTQASDAKMRMGLSYTWRNNWASNNLWIACKTWGLAYRISVRRPVASNVIIRVEKAFVSLKDMIARGF